MCCCHQRNSSYFTLFVSQPIQTDHISFTHILHRTQETWAIRLPQTVRRSGWRSCLMNARMNSAKPLEYMMVNANLFWMTEFYSNSLHFKKQPGCVFFFSQLMIIFLSMTTRKTSGTGPIGSEENILIKSMLKLRDWQRRLLDTREGKANRRESRRSRATRNCMRGCRGSMKSIWHERRVKKKKPGRRRSAGTSRGVRPLFTLALPLAARSWATTTSPGLLHGAQCRKCWKWCCTVSTERTCKPFVKCSGSSKRCGTQINLLRDVKLG